MQNPHHALLLNGRPWRGKGSMVQNHAPAVRGQKIYIRCKYGWDDFISIRQGERFVDTVYRECLPLMFAQLADLQFRIRALRKNLRKTPPDRGESCESRALRMNTHDARFISPDGHHEIEIGALESIVKRSFAVTWTREQLEGFLCHGAMIARFVVVRIRAAVTAVVRLRVVYARGTRNRNPGDWSDTDSYFIKGLGRKLRRRTPFGGHHRRKLALEARQCWTFVLLCWLCSRRGSYY